MLTGLEIQPDGGILRNITESLKSIKELLTPKHQDSIEIKSIKLFTMNEDFACVRNLLAVDSLTENEGKLELTPEMLQTIENRLNELESQVNANADAMAERDNTIAALNEQIANLQAAPADETTQVDEATEDNAPVNALDMYNQIKDII